MPADVNTAFDVAFYFEDIALNDHEYLQPMKLQRLLFLAQAYYAVAFKGRQLMPAVFVADELGPIEPNIYIAFTKGRPDVDVDLFMPHDITTFLDNIWKRFGPLKMDRLNELVKGTVAYRNARERGDRATISLEEMAKSFIQGTDAPSPEHVVKPKILVTQSGKPVTVKAWVPGTKP